MYTVYVLDDEPFILDEIINDIPWLDNGFVVVGSNTSPDAAISEILEMKPDLVFSDLKIPCMDGVEVIKTLNDAGLDCEYIMLSAYPSFEDSRRFFRLNGFDYLLKPIEQAEVQLALERVSCRLSEKRPAVRDDAVNMDAHNVNPAFTELMSFIQSNFNQKHTLESLGKRFNLSANYICNLFSKHCDTTLTRYITKLRMEEAVRRMSENDKAFKEIATECGYSDYYYFCKVFKEYYGAPPTSYMHKNGAGN